MAAFKILRKIIQPRNALIFGPSLGFIPVLFAEEKKLKPCCMKKLPKPSELPIYKNPEDAVEYELVESNPGVLEENISTIRKSMSKYMSSVEIVTSKVKDVYDTGMAHSKSTYEMIVDGDSVLPRAAAITAGGLTGLLLSARGGVIKKVVYPVTGIAVVTSACYPKAALAYTQSWFHTAREFTVTNVKEYTGYDMSEVSLKKIVDIDELKKKYTPPSFEDMMQKVTGKSPKSVPEDHGQSNPADKDLYTTRT